MVIKLGKRYLKNWEKKIDHDVEDLSLDELFEYPVASSIK
jgi:hypothetical protein